MARALIGLLQQNSDVGHRNCHLLDEMARVGLNPFMLIVQSVDRRLNFTSLWYVCLKYNTL